jgi:type IV secretion system protein VirD4
MLDEFPALGRLDFFETALAFLAGYGVRAFLIAQSLNQIVKAYGENNAILDNCHVRVAFAANDERTARRISDALGTATELRAMRNYAGHRLAPWLAHVMVSRQETSRPLLTPGEVMQLDPRDQLVLVSGLAPVRARKLRYYEDRNFTGRVLPPPVVAFGGGWADAPEARLHDWEGRRAIAEAADRTEDGPGADGGLQQAREPALPSRPRRKGKTPKQVDQLGFDLDDDGVAVVGPAALAPVVAAHAVNQGSARGDDLVPSF